MNSTKKLFIASILLIAASIFSIVSLIKDKAALTSGNNNADLVLYYGSSCPHCKIVEEFIAKNEQIKKLNISQKEVWNNAANQKEFVAAAKNCQLDTENLGVPTLWDVKNSKCYVGDQPIIDYLRQQAPITETQKQ